MSKGVSGKAKDPWIMFKNKNSNTPSNFTQIVPTDL